ncbi:unnamed protein product [Diplocarpon coronariae]
MNNNDTWPSQNDPPKPTGRPDASAQAELVTMRELAIADAINTGALSSEARMASSSSSRSLAQLGASALRQLVLQLSDQEIIDLRIRLNAIKTADNFSVRLPLELRVLIFGYLGLEDLLRIRCVSRSWNAAFSDENFCLFLLKNHFPKKYEDFSSLEADHDADNLHLKQQQARVSLKAWFEDAIRARVRRVQGRYHSTSRYRHVDPRVPASAGEHAVYNPQYNNGRIAFLNQGERTLVVKSLYSDAEGQFVNENREPFHPEAWLLSDEYIIAMTIHPTTLFAWSLENLGEPCQQDPSIVRLPSHVQTLSARGGSVGVLTLGFEVYIWQINLPGKPFSKLDVVMPVSDEGLCSYDTVVAFHPYDSSRLFIGTHRKLSKEKSRCEFAEFKDAELQSTYEVELARPAQGVLFSALHDGVIGMLSLTDAQERNLFGVPDRVLLSFDMDSKHFEWQHYTLSIHRDIAASQGAIWRGQFLAPGYPDENLQSAGYISVVNHSPGWSAQRYWFAVDKYLLENRDEWGRLKVRCDDKFVVLFGTWGYQVWCFDLNVTLRVKDSEPESLV